MKKKTNQKNQKIIKIKKKKNGSNRPINSQM